MSTYFDAVLDQRFNPIFNGTPEETIKWLEGMTPISDWQVCIGRTMQTVPVATYIQSHREKEQITRERKGAMVRDLVFDAVREARQCESRSKPEAIVINVAVENIMGVFGENE